MLARLLSRSNGEDLGRRGERIAARHLRRKGYRVLARNARVSVGEADIVCRGPDRETIVIVEVKTRRRGQSESSDAIPPESSITRAKRRKLLSVTRTLVRANGWEHRPVRIDVVAVEFEPTGRRATVRHYESAVTG